MEWPHTPACKPSSRVRNSLVETGSWRALRCRKKSMSTAVSSAGDAVLELAAFSLGELLPLALGPREAGALGAAVVGLQVVPLLGAAGTLERSEEHTSELQSPL